MVQSIVILRKRPDGDYDTVARRCSAPLYVVLIITTATLLSAVGCTWQQAYSTAQGWQRNQCYRLIEQAERDRCLDITAMAYDDYRRQVEAKKD